MRVGIVGSGFGTRVILPCLQAAKGVQVVAWATRDPERAAASAKQHGVDVLPGVDALLARSDVDAVFLATPPATHASLAKPVLEAGVTLVCEKPLAPTSEEAARLRALARGRRAFVDHQLRFHPNLSLVRSLLRDGAIGKPLHAELSYLTATRADPRKPWDWWSDASQGGGQLLALGSHLVDMLRWWFGEPRSASGNLRTFTSERPGPDGDLLPVTSDDAASFALEFPNGFTTRVLTSTVDRDEPGLDVRVVGDSGTLILRGFDDVSISEGPGKRRSVSRRDELLGVPVVGLNPWRTSLVRFGESLARGDVADAATFDDGWRTQLVLDAISLSHREKRPIGIKGSLE